MAALLRYHQRFPQSLNISTQSFGPTVARLSSHRGYDICYLERYVDRGLRLSLAPPFAPRKSIVEAQE